MTPYIARTLSGRTIQYTSHEALQRARTRRKDVIVDSWSAEDPPPFGSSDAASWNDYRQRHRYSGERS